MTAPPRYALNPAPLILWICLKPEDNLSENTVGVSVQLWLPGEEADLQWVGGHMKPAGTFLPAQLEGLALAPVGPQLGVHLALTILGPGLRTQTYSQGG